MTDPIENPSGDEQAADLPSVSNREGNLSPTLLDPVVDSVVTNPVHSEVNLPQIPGYEVLAQIGQGGMGVVFLARHGCLNRLVALKMIRDGLLATPAHLSRFHSEARAVARLQHPQIVQIFEIGEHQGRPYFALELVEGGNLSQRLARAPMQPIEAAELIQGLACAIHHAHTQGIVHRDLKPANLLLTPEGELKVVDFGLAKELGAEIFLSHSCSDTLLGTPSYMAPEQAWGPSENVGPQADIYALGAILYECLTGRPPFLAGSLLEVLEQLRDRDPVPPTRLNSAVPRDLETICLKCLAKVPSQRYASALDLARDITRFRSGEPIEARRVPFLERAWKWMRRRPAFSVMAGMLLLLALLATAGIWYAGRWANLQQEAARADLNRAQYPALLQQAQKALAQQRTDLAQKFLEECPPEVRGWEWDILSDLATGQIPPRLAGLKQPIQAIAFDNRQQHLYAATETGLRGWDQQTLTELPVLPTGGRVRDLTLSPDGRYLAALVEPTRQPGPARLLLPLPLQWFTPVPTFLRAIPVLRSLPTVAAGCMMPLVIPEAELAPRDPVASPAPPQGPAVLVVPTRRDEVLVWDLSKRKLIIRWICPSGAGFQAPLKIAFHPEGRQLVVLTTARPALLVPPQQGAKVRFDPFDGNLLQCRTELSQELPLESGLVLAPQSLLAFFDLRKPSTPPRIVPLEGEACASLIFSPDGRTLMLGTLAGQVRRIDPTTGKMLGELLSPMGGTIVSLAFDSSGKCLAAGTAEGHVDIWNTATNELLHMLPGHSAAVGQVRFHPDHFRLCTLGADGFLKVWDSATGQPLLTTRVGPSPHHPAIAIDNSGKLTAVANFSEEDGHGITLFGARVARKPKAWQSHPAEVVGGIHRKPTPRLSDPQPVPAVNLPTPIPVRGVSPPRLPQPSEPEALQQGASVVSPPAAPPVPLPPDQPAISLP